MHATQDAPTVSAGRRSVTSAAEHGPQPMRAIVQNRYGSADVLEIRHIARPAIAADEVLIEVHAAGVNRGTWHLVTGLPYAVRLAGHGITKPKNPTPGADVAGRVVAVGADATRFAPGDAVFGIANGAFAEYAAASQDKLAHKPATLTFAQAAITVVSGITALQALTDVADLRPGQRVLIIGASGAWAPTRSNSPRRWVAS